MESPLLPLFRPNAAFDDVLILDVPLLQGSACDRPDCSFPDEPVRILFTGACQKLPNNYDLLDPLLSLAPLFFSSIDTVEGRGSIEDGFQLDVRKIHVSAAVTRG